jgi:nicotinamidase-related amidase
MTGFETLFCVAWVATCAAAIVYMLYAVKDCGRDRPHDPERVRRLVATAPYEFLDVVLDDARC